MSEGGEARNHEAEVEAVARALDHWVLGGEDLNLRAAQDAIAALDAVGSVLRSPKGEDHELREKIADELAHNDECGSRQLASRAEYLADADAILRIVGERSPQDEAGRRRYPTILTGEAATAARHAEHGSPQGEDHETGLAEFQEGLTSALNRHGVPAMPSWDAAIDWLAEHGPSPVSGTELDTAKLRMLHNMSYREIADYVHRLETDAAKLMEAGDRLAAAIRGLDSYAASSQTAPLERAQRALKRWDKALAGFSVDAPTEPDTARLVAGIQWVRGMCSDEEPYEVIDATLAELLDGASGGGKGGET